MEVDENDHEWELSKENVQPLRNGREMASLAAALRTDQSDHQTIKATQNDFEVELRTYSGDDPFGVWDRYVKWTEQHFPKGGHDGQLMMLIERCLKAFQGDERYTNDTRFIDMWIKYAYAADDPAVVFTYAFDNGIGSKVAALYVEWAIFLERMGNTKRADAMYTEGLNRCAEPRDMLQEKHQQFQSRVARNITLQIADNQNPGMDMGDSEEKRTVLGRLKGMGTSHRVGTTRTGAALLGPAQGLRNSKPAAQKQIPSRGIAIYSDAENIPPDLAPQQTKEWQSMPVKAVDNRENDKKPGVWTEGKVKQKTGVVPSVAPAVAFQIHEDPESEKLPMQTPQKTTFINTQPLSSHKAVQRDVLVNLRAQASKATDEVRQVPMYQKDKIYNGLSEFSFEELRAVKYWKQKKKRETEAERQRQEEERRLREEQMQQQLQETNRKLAAVEALLQAHMGGLSINSASGVEQQQQHLQSGPQLPQDSQQHQQQSQNNQQDSTQLHTSQPHQPVSASGSLAQQPRQEASGKSDASDFITPTNEILPLNGSQVRSSGSSARNQNTSSLNRSQRTPIFNSAAAYTSLSSGSSHSSSLSRSISKPVSAASSRNISTTTPVGFEGNTAGTKSQAFPSTNVSRSTMASSGTDNNKGLKYQTSSPSSDLMTPMWSDHLSGGSSRLLSDSLSNSMGSHGKFNRTTTPGSDDQPSFSGGVASFNKSNRTTTPKSGGPTPESFDSCIRKGPLTAPSPTVFTKEAMQCVMGMFSTSLSHDQQMTEEMESFDASSTGKKGVFEIREDTAVGQTEMERQTLKTDTHGPQMQIYCDEPEDKENMGAVAVPKSQIKKAFSAGKGLQIYQDEPENTERGACFPSARKSARRGLGFHGSNDYEEMVEDREEFPHLNCDFTIECQAKTDMTLAPLDSFSIHARLASTPCVSSVDKSLVPPQEVSETTSSCSTSSAVTANYSDGAPTPSKQNLSPIFEGSGEGSGEDTKSSTQQSHTVSGICANITTRKRHGSSLSRDPIREDVEMREEEENYGDVSMSDDQQLDKSCHHQIDTTAYIPDVEDKAETSLSTSICLDPKDPFDDKTIAHFLKTLNPPLTQLPNYVARSGPTPDMEMETYLMLGNLYIDIETCIGEGGYAKVYKIIENNLDGDDTLNVSSIAEKVIKVQKPPCHWEFYVSFELRRRLKSLGYQMDVTPAIMEVERGFFFDDGSVLQMNYLPAGSLLNLVNKYKSNRPLLLNVEPYACLLTIELLHMFEQIHKCGFIHGDVKPDNFLLLDLPEVKNSKDPRVVFGSRLRLVQLIDFGQSIDMTKFPRGTTFTAKVVTSGFQCIEMRTDRPWTFQTDLFGLAGTIHVALFGSYMNVFQEHGVWRITGNFIRKWNVDLWKKFFKILLNIPSCDCQPDLAQLRAEFENHFMQNLIPSYNSWVLDMRTMDMGS